MVRERGVVQFVRLRYMQITTRTWESPPQVPSIVVAQWHNNNSWCKSIKLIQCQNCLSLQQVREDALAGLSRYILHERQFWRLYCTQIQGDSGRSSGGSIESSDASSTMTMGLLLVGTGGTVAEETVNTEYGLSRHIQPVDKGLFMKDMFLSRYLYSNRHQPHPPARYCAHAADLA